MHDGPEEIYKTKFTTLSSFNSKPYQIPFHWTKKHKQLITVKRRMLTIFNFGQKAKYTSGKELLN